MQDKLKGQSYKDVDLKEITKEYLHYNIAPDVQSSGKYFPLRFLIFVCRGRWLRQHDCRADLVRQDQTQLRRTTTGTEQTDHAHFNIVTYKSDFKFGDFTNIFTKIMNKYNAR